MARRRVITIVGTRPEAIKMAPVIREFARRYARFEQIVVSTGQHREMLAQALATFAISPDVDLGLMERGQTPPAFAARCLSALTALFCEQRPDWVFVQGDTTTVMAAALAAYYQGIRVGHVEAGLRSHNPRNPFPEEIYRRIASCIADLHFAPTEGARANLLREGVPAERVFVTGNTIVDALQSIRLDDGFADPSLERVDYQRHRVLLVTAHRRENHGAPLHAIAAALKSLVESHADVAIVYPVHLNPRVRAAVTADLAGVERIYLTDPVSYTDLLRLMKRCYFILTDSGGILEEAPSFHKPVLILREVTERPEVVAAGVGRIVGADTHRIVAEATALLDDPGRYQGMCTAQNPFGDGRAAERIADIFEQHAGWIAAPLPPD